MNRYVKGCVGLLSVSALVLGLAACSKDSSSSASSDGVVNITFMHRMVDKGDNTVDGIIDEFNKEHPNIHVTGEKMQGATADTYAKISSIVQGGTNVPCLVQIGSERLGDMSNLFQDVTEYTEQYKDQLVDGAYEKGVLGDTSYGLPMGQSPLALFYRTDLFKQYGIDVPTTWDEYKADAEKIRDASGGKSYLGVFEVDEQLMLSALTSSEGAEWYNYDPDSESWEVNVDDAASEKVANYWQGLIDDKDVMATQRWGENFNKYLADGTLVAHIGGPWEAPLISSAAPDTSGKWAVAPLPHFDASNTSVGQNGGSLITVTRTCENPEEAVEFAGWWATHADSQIGIGAFPATKSESIETPDSLKTFFGGQDIYDVFLDANEHQADITWAPKIADTFTEMANVMGKVGVSTTVPDVLAAAQKTSVATLEAAGVSVKE